MVVAPSSTSHARWPSRASCASLRRSVVVDRLNSRLTAQAGRRPVGPTAIVSECGLEAGDPARSGLGAAGFEGPDASSSEVDLHEARSRAEQLASGIADRKLSIVSGKGGVGRTTVALLVGLGMALRGARVLVATTGRDDRLAWMVGRDRLGTAPVAANIALFQGHAGVGSLEIQKLDPLVCVRQYGEFVLRSRRAAGLVFDNALVRGLLAAVPGIDDFSVLGKVWHEAVRVSNYDHVVFDGPASGHLHTTLAVPRTIMETIPGGPLVAEAERISASLADARVSAAIWVALAESWPLAELAQLADQIRAETGLASGAVVVNELCRFADLDRADAAESSEFAEAERLLLARSRGQAAALDTWLRGEGHGLAGPQTPTLGLDWLARGVRGERDLAELLMGLSKLRAKSER